jgi:hypothetical protein
MNFSAKPVAVPDILRLRDMYRLEMSCQIIHDSLHFRDGWKSADELQLALFPST